MKISKIFFIALISISILLLAGCGLVDNLQNYKDSGSAEDIPEPDNGQTIQQQVELTDQDQQGPVDEKDTDEQPTASSGDITGDPKGEDGSQNEQQKPVVGDNELEVVLYFMNSDGSSLEGETRVIPKQEGLARATINQLIAGPKSASLSPTLPSSASLEGINIANGVCTVDFNSSLLNDMSEDTDDQLLALYSIVNTLTQFDTIDQVKILVGGRTLDTLGGVDVSSALAPMKF